MVITWAYRHTEGQLWSAMAGWYRRVAALTTVLFGESEINWSSTAVQGELVGDTDTAVLKPQIPNNSTHGLQSSGSFPGNLMNSQTFHESYPLTAPWQYFPILFEHSPGDVQGRMAQLRFISTFPPALWCLIKEVGLAPLAFALPGLWRLTCPMCLWRWVI